MDFICQTEYTMETAKSPCFYVFHLKLRSQPYPNDIFIYTEKKKEMTVSLPNNII